MNLKPSENRLVGAIVVIDGKPVFDEVANRINQLIADKLEHVCDDESGWLSLFKDPTDGRHWERSYVQSGQHGAGAPSLSVIDGKQLSERYKI